MSDGGDDFGYSQEVSQVPRQVFLLVVRVQNVGVHAYHHGGNRGGCQRFVQATAPQSNIVPVEGVGERHVGTCAEAFH